MFKSAEAVLANELVVPAAVLLLSNPLTAVAAMVMVSVLSLVVTVMPEPAAIVRVSFTLSASSGLCPATAMLVNVLG